MQNNLCLIWSLFRRPNARPAAGPFQTQQLPPNPQQNTQQDTPHSPARYTMASRKIVLSAKARGPALQKCAPANKPTAKAKNKGPQKATPIVGDQNPFGAYTDAREAVSDQPDPQPSFPSPKSHGLFLVRFPQAWCRK